MMRYARARGGGGGGKLLFDLKLSSCVTGALVAVVAAMAVVAAG